MSAEETPDDILSSTAKPIYRVPPLATLFDFGVEHDVNGEPIAAPFDVGADPLLNALVASIPESSRIVQRLPDRPPYSQSMDWGLVLGSLAAFWQLAGLPGAIQIGKRIRDWVKGAKGRSADAGAMLLVAICYVKERYPSATPDPNRAQVLNPVSPSRYPRDHQVVFLYRR